VDIALIGCGVSGSAIAVQLTREGLSTIKLIDINLNRANKLLHLLHSITPKLVVDVFRVNATKTKEIENILDDVDVVINAASPICNIPIMKACLNSDTNYIDLASDPFRYSGIMEGTTLDEQLELHDEFLDMDLVAVTNTGFSPGFTDILCRYIVDTYNLDMLNSVKIYFAEVIESDKLVASWSPYIFLLEVLFPPTVFSKNRIIELDYHKGTKYIKFPPPIGTIKAKIFNGHPELRTIPEFINVPVEYIEIGGGAVLNGLQLNDIIVEALSKKVRENIVFNGDVLEILSSAFEDPDKFGENYKKGIIRKDTACCLIEIKGKKGENILNYQAIIQHDIKETIKDIPIASVPSFMVSFTPTIIAREIIYRRIKERGVIAPAALSIASEIISECKKMGLNIKEFIRWEN